MKIDKLPIADHILDCLLHNILLLDNKLIIQYANYASRQFFQLIQENCWVHRYQFFLIIVRLIWI